MNGNTVLVTGGSHAELPMIKALHEMGFRVITTGNNTEGLGHKEADEYVPGDFSDPSFVLELAKEKKVSGIVSGCNDFAYLSTAYAAQELGLPGHDDHETSKDIHHKDRFRSLCKKCGARIPDFFSFTEPEGTRDRCEGLGYPLIIKPIDLTGGKGVRICHDYREVMEAFEEARRWSRQPRFLAEQMIQGENHGVSALVVKAEVRFAFFDNEEYYLNPYLVSGAYYPSSLTEETKHMIIRDIERISAQAGLVDGLFHCQCIVQEDGTPYLIDPCRRAPGDLYLKLVELGTGIPYARLIVQAELGLGLEEALQGIAPQENCIARECIMASENGRVERIVIEEELKQYVTESLIWGNIGEIIEDYMKYKAGIVFFSFPSRDVMEKALARLRSDMRIEVS